MRHSWKLAFFEIGTPISTPPLVGRAAAASSLKLGRFAAAAFTHIHMFPSYRWLSGRIISWFSSSLSRIPLWDHPQRSCKESKGLMPLPLRANKLPLLDAPLDESWLAEPALRYITMVTMSFMIDCCFNCGVVCTCKFWNELVFLYFGEWWYWMCLFT